MLEKYNVNISLHKGSYAYQGKTLCHCQMTDKEITEYQETFLKTHEAIPESSCLRHLKAQFNDHTMKTIFLAEVNEKVESRSSETHTGGFEINLLLKKHCKCSKRDCVRNIKTGKCSDDFIIQTIGKKFFQEQYNNQQTKQR